MKREKFIYIHLFFIILAMAGYIWAFAELIMYLAFKDPFNWISLKLFVTGTIIVVVNFLVLTFYLVKENESKLRKL